MLKNYYDLLVEEFTTGKYYREVYNAKQEFFDKAGVIYEDDSEYESRMCIFMDWYLFDRDLPGVDLPPVKLYARSHRQEWDAETTKVFDDLSQSIHSIFQMKKKRLFSSGLVVVDLFSGKKYAVNDPQIKQNFSRGDVFEGRIVKYNDQFEFAKGFCFHPAEMKGFILSEIKKVRYQEKGKHTKLIFQLSNMKLKHVRYHHIDVKHIYRFDSKFQG